MSKATDLADALVLVLNDSDNVFSQVFEAQRLATPVLISEILESLSVYVFTGTRSSERRGRPGAGVSGFAHTYKPVIGVQKKISVNDDETRKAESDALLLVVEEIEQLFEDAEKLVDLEIAQGLEFAGFDESSQERDAYDHILLRQDGVFAAEIVLQFQD